MQTHESQYEKNPSGSTHPYLDWAIATGFAYLRPGDWLPLLVEFDKKTSRDDFTRLNWLDEDAGTLKSDVRVAELFNPLPKLLRESNNFNFCVLLVFRKRAADLVGHRRWKQTILRAELGPPVHLAGAPEPGKAGSSDLPVVGMLARWFHGLRQRLRSSPAPKYSAQRIVVAVIDQGIAFAHPRFSTPAGTRIEYLWQQDAIGPSGTMNSPGVELTAAMIDPVVQNAKTSGAGEDSVYRTIGGLDMRVEGYKPLARRRSHGTHVLDLAAGDNPGVAGSNRPIIAVDMPEEAVGDPAGSTLTVHAVLGLIYILDRAEKMRRAGETLPVVVNISYGPHDGPHDGSSPFEVIADFLTLIYQSTPTPLRIVLAAGNYRQSRNHANFQLLPNRPRTLQWRLQPGGQTPSFMEIWLPNGSSAGVSVKLISPAGQQLSVSPAKLLDPVNGGSGQLLASAQYRPNATGSLRSSVVLFVAPTANDPWIAGGHPVAASGIWFVEIKNNNVDKVLDIDAWIKRSDTPGGRRAKGRQSYFDDPAYEGERHEATPEDPTRPREFDKPGSASYVKRQGTLSGIATGTETCVIGAYRRGPGPEPQPGPKPYSCELMPARYSSEGQAATTTGPGIRAPNWLAPGDDAPSCPGALGAGTRSGARIAMNGTSVAAPQATRYFADQWAAGPVPGKAPVKLRTPSTRVPPADRPLVAGKGVMPFVPQEFQQPPISRRWKDRP